MAQAENKSTARNDGAGVPATRDWMPFNSLRREIDRLFEDLMPVGRRRPAQRSVFDLDFAKPMTDWAVYPAFDLIEKDKEYEITAELPGVDEKNVEIKLNNNLLTIRGEKSESKEEKEKDYFLSERRFGSFQRSFQVPNGIDADKIEASYSKGVLTVRLPKSAEGQKTERRISIKPS